MGGEQEEDDPAMKALEWGATGSSWLGRAAHIAEPLLEGSAIAEKLPFVGAAAGGLSAGLNLGMAGYDFAKQGAHSDAGYEHLGGAALGGAGAALSCTPYGLALAGAELQTDALGYGAGKLFGKEAGFNADKVAGGLIRGTMGDKSMGWGAGSWVSDHLGGGTLGKIAGTGVGAAINLNPIGLGMNLGKTVGTGLWDEGKAIWHGLNDPTTMAGGAMKSIGGAASSAWGGIKSGVSGIGHALGGLFSDKRLKRDVRVIDGALALL